MAKKTLNAENLSKLGADRLAELLIEISKGHADTQRRLRLELAHALGPQELARDLRKRMVTLRRAKSNVSWRKRKGLVTELDALSDMICTRVGSEDPTLGFDLLWEFLDLPPSVFARVSDPNGEVAAVFDSARAQLAPLADRALLDPDALADRIWAVVIGAGQDIFEGVVADLAPALGETGLDRLAQLVDDYEASPLPEPDLDHEALAFLRALRSETGNYHADQKARLIRRIRQDIATARGDVDALMSELSPAALRHPDTGAELAEKLLQQGRSEDALTRLQGSRPDPDEDSQRWDAAYIACLKAMGRNDAVQSFRKQCFETRLDGGMLRAYLAELPDFDDVEAEDAARAHALGFDDIGAALRFFSSWPDLPALADLMQRRRDELGRLPLADLTEAAEKLRTRFPLAAMLSLRAALRHPHVGQEQLAELLADCTVLDAEIPDYDGLPDHATFVDTLKKRWG